MFIVTHGQILRCLIPYNSFISQRKNYNYYRYGYKSISECPVRWNSLTKEHDICIFLLHHQPCSLISLLPLGELYNTDLAKCISLSLPLSRPTLDQTRTQKARPQMIFTDLCPRLRFVTSELLSKHVTMNHTAAAGTFFLPPISTLSTGTSFKITLVPHPRVRFPP